MVKYNEMIINNKKNFIFTYTAIFALLMGMIVFFYYSSGNSLINFGGDGFRQYFRALVYYSNYLKTIGENLINNHKLLIPQWDFSIGEGSDVLITFHYYGMGDIINLFSVLVPENQMYLFYDASVVLRVYLSGLFFSYLCTYSGKKNYDAVLAGSILYAFSGFSLVSISGHIAFLNAPVYLPLVIVGVEKIIREEGFFLLSVSVALISMASFYFFYMIALMTVIFVIVRLLCMKTDWVNRGNILLKIAAGSILGVLISAVIFLPYAYATLTSSRVSGSIETPLLYSLNYYLENARSLVFSYGNLFGNYSILFIPAVILLSTRSQSKELRILLIIAVVFVCLPVFGLLFNGFVYATDRWVFGFALLAFYIIVDSFDELLTEKKKAPLLCFASVLYLVFCAAADKEQWQVYALYSVVLFVTFAMIFLCNKRKITSFITAGAAVFCALFSIFYRFSPIYWNYSKNGTPISAAESVRYEQASVLVGLEEGFYRYSADEFVTNSSIHTAQSTTQYYWSLANDNVIEFRNYLGLSDHNNHHYDTYDERLLLNSLAGVKYFVSQSGRIPYGYHHLGTNADFEIYSTDNSLPMFYAYTNTINKEDWKELDILSKQQVLLNAAVVENNVDYYGQLSSAECYDVDFKIETEEGIQLTEGMIRVTNPGASLTVDFECEKANEYYLIVEGFDSEISTNIRVNDLSDMPKVLYFKCRTHNAYPNRHDFALCLGTSEQNSGHVSVTFPDSGEFSCSAIKIQKLDIETQIAGIDNLKNITIDELNIGTNEIKSNIKVDQKSTMCISIPYADGWKAFVDGKEIEIEKVNIMYMGFEMEAGDHEIKLVYATPCLKAGAMITSAGIAILAVAAIIKRKKVVGE